MRLSPDRVVRIAGAWNCGQGLTSEQRRDPRLSLRGTVTVSVLDANHRPGPSFGARVYDLAAGGVGLLLHHPLRKGDQLVVTLPDLDDEPGLPVLCTTRYVRPAGERLYRVGVEFVSVASTAPTRAVAATAD